MFMIIECVLEKIKKAVIFAEQITGKNLSLPVLANIILEIKDRSLKIKSTNLDLGLEIYIPCKITNENNLSIALNGVLFNTFFIHSQELTKALKSVWLSASFSAMKPEISSVCFYQQPDNLVLLATDSFRLAEKIIKGGKNKLAVNQLIVPLKNIIKIIKIIDFLDEDLEIKYDQHQISFNAKDFYLTSRLIDGVYPDYRQIISTHWETEITVSRLELLNLLKLA